MMGRADLRLCSNTWARLPGEKLASHALPAQESWSPPFSRALAPASRVSEPLVPTVIVLSSYPPIEPDFESNSTLACPLRLHAKTR